MQQHSFKDIPYKIRESARAKRSKLCVSQQDGLTVVVPKGRKIKNIDKFLLEKEFWIKEALSKVNHIQKDRSLPTEVNLKALNSSWNISYQQTALKTVKVVEDKHNNLCVYGNVENESLCKKALRTWLNKKAKHFLVNQINIISSKTDLNFAGINIKNQRSRWGSCSIKNDISLNQKLIFMPLALLDYVIIHELCHTKHHNHSSEFWHLVKHHCPTYKTDEAHLKTAWHHIPAWADSNN